jgi:hypothetical protein
MIKFQVSEDEQWLILLEFEDDVEKKQIEISLTKKIHNFYFHPLVRKKLWTGDICFIEKKGGLWKIPIGLWREIIEIGKEYRFKGEALDKIFNQQETHYTGGTKNSNLYTELSAFLGGDKETSLLLLRAGIDGIKYKAGTLSGMEDEEGYNYVIFNADDVTIEGKEKYADGGEINKNMKNEIIEILSKNARYGTNIFDLQEVGFERVPKAITGVGLTVTTVPVLVADVQPDAFVT